jgi:hypothetical protein
MTRGWTHVANVLISDDETALVYDIGNTLYLNSFLTLNESVYHFFSRLFKEKGIKQAKDANEPVKRKLDQTMERGEKTMEEIKEQVKTAT